MIINFGSLSVLADNAGHVLILEFKKLILKTSHSVKLSITSRANDNQLSRDDRTFLVFTNSCDMRNEILFSKIIYCRTRSSGIPVMGRNDT